LQSEGYTTTSHPREIQGNDDNRISKSFNERFKVNYTSNDPYLLARLPPSILFEKRSDSRHSRSSHKDRTTQPIGSVEEVPTKVTKLESIFENDELEDDSIHMNNDSDEVMFQIDGIKGKKKHRNRT